MFSSCSAAVFPRHSTLSTQLHSLAKHLLPSSLTRPFTADTMFLPALRPKSFKLVTLDDVPDAERASSCIIPTTWVDFPLVASHRYNHDTIILDFGLPEGVSLSLPTCACILVRGFTQKSKEAIRPYTPISNNSMLGKFQLMIKVYNEGVVSKYCEGLKVGEALSFKHVIFNCKVEYPFGKKSITMVAGGTGITPMYQALQCLIDTPGDNTEIMLLYGNKAPWDILLKDELNGLIERSAGRLKIVHVLSEPNAVPKDWSGEMGYMDKALITKYAFKPSADTAFFVCGVPVMYDMLCGPRNEKEVKEGTILHQLGYDETMVCKF